MIIECLTTVKYWLVAFIGVEQKSIFNSVTRGPIDPAMVKVCLAGMNQAFWFMTIERVTGKSFLTHDR